MKINSSSNTNHVKDSKNENKSIYEQLSLDNSQTIYDELMNIHIAVSSTKNRFEGSHTIQDVISGNRYIARGEKSEDVKLVQSALRDLGFYPGDIVDGKFGPLTLNALKNFQNSRNLPESGILDKETMKELNEITPPLGKKLWDKDVLGNITTETHKNNIVPSNDLLKGRKAKIVVDLSEHRLFLYNDDNSLKKVYSVATGKNGHADGRGGKTHAGIKIINYKDNDPSRVSNQLWPEANGKAFGTKLLDLSWYDLNTGKKKSSGEELHGTFSLNSIGTDASHGCMRMKNEDAEEIFKQVKVGDIVKVQD